MQAVQFLLSSRERMNSERLNRPNLKADSNKMETELQKVDPIQVSWLLHSGFHLKQSITNIWSQSSYHQKKIIKNCSY